jgi:hypothetical protein
MKGGLDDSSVIVGFRVHSLCRAFFHLGRSLGLNHSEKGVGSLFFAQPSIRQTMNSGSV